jgi:predicted RNase H-like HicB family nuclease
LELQVTIEVWKSRSWYVARIPELDFVSQGNDPEEAKRNVQEVARMQLDEMRNMGTLRDYLEECGFTFQDNVVVPQTEMISCEKSLVTV